MSGLPPSLIIDALLALKVPLNGGGGGGAVTSVNGHTGVVVLDQTDLALPQSIQFFNLSVTSTQTIALPLPAMVIVTNCKSDGTSVLKMSDLTSVPADYEGQPVRILNLVPSKATFKVTANDGIAFPTVVPYGWILDWYIVGVGSQNGGVANKYQSSIFAVAGAQVVDLSAGGITTLTNPCPTVINVSATKDDASSVMKMPDMSQFGGLLPGQRVFIFNSDTVAPFRLEDNAGTALIMNFPVAPYWAILSLVEDGTQGGTWKVINSADLMWGMNNLGDIQDPVAATQNLNIPYATAAYNTDTTLDTTVGTVLANTNANAVTLTVTQATNNLGRSYEIIKAFPQFDLTISGLGGMFGDTISTLGQFGKSLTFSGIGTFYLKAGTSNTWYVTVVRPAPGMALLPNQILGLNAWYDASDPNDDGTQPADGSNITVWKDKGGTSKDMTASGIFPVFQAAATANGMPAISNVGIGAHMQNAAGIDCFTMFAVIYYPNSAGSAEESFLACDTASSTFPAYQYEADNDIVLAPVAKVLATGSGANAQGVFIQNQFYIYSSTTNSSTLAVDIQQNGIKTGTSSYTGTLKPRSGPTQLFAGFTSNVVQNVFNGAIAEVIIYNRVLNPTERQYITNYLGAKYGITV